MRDICRPAAGPGVMANNVNEVNFCMNCASCGRGEGVGVKLNRLRLEMNYVLMI